MIRTDICDLLGIDYPIIQGGMACISDARLASAVSDGGGLGIISSMAYTADELRGQIRLARTLTSKPFGVNIMLKSSDTYEKAQVVIEERVPVVTTGAGNPGKFADEWFSAGIKVLPVVPSAAIARAVERRGVSAVIAEGGESGGHVGELSTMSLIPQVADAVKVPVIAAGGIGDGRGAAAAFMLGAQGVQAGTAFLLAGECAVHPNYKRAVINASDKDTTVLCRGTGHPMRVIKNQFARDFLNKSADLTDEEQRRLMYTALKRAAVDGDTENGCVVAGQIAGMLQTERKAAEIIREIFAEAEKLLMSTARWIK